MAVAIWETVNYPMERTWSDEDDSEGELRTGETGTERRQAHLELQRRLQENSTVWPRWNAKGEKRHQKTRQKPNLQLQGRLLYVTVISYGY